MDKEETPNPTRACLSCGSYFTPNGRKQKACSPTCYIRTKITVDPTTGCWNWPVTKSERYGFATWNGAKQLAHRFSHKLFNGPIGPKKCVRHRCDNCACVNPDHLVEGTAQDNVNDKMERGRYRARSGRKPFLKTDQLRQIRSSSATTRSLAAKYGVSENTIRSARQGRTFKSA